MTSSHNQRQSWTSVRTPFIINPFPPPSVLQGRQSSIWFYLLLLLLCPGLLAVPLEEDIDMPRSHAPPGSQVLTQGRWAGSERVSAGCPGVLETVCRPGWDHFRPGCFSCYQRARTTVICCGPNVTDVPTDLPTNVTHLTLIDTGIAVLKARRLADHSSPHSPFCMYKELTFLSLRANSLLETIELGAFHFKCGKPSDVLSYLIIENSPKLITIDNSAFGRFDRLQILRVKECALSAIPDWGIFSPGPGQALTVLDLQRNRIRKVPKYAFSKIDGEIGELILSGNEIEEVEDYAFANAKVATINLTDNDKLTILGERAFTNTTLLHNLDLSRTNIEKLPVSGLESLKNLTLRDVPTLKIFPPVLRFLSVKNMHLTYPYHCCAFKYPQKQNAQLFQQVMEEIDKECRSTAVTSPMTTSPQTAALPVGQVIDSSSTEGFGFSRNRRVPRWLRSTLEAIRNNDPDKEKLTIRIRSQGESPYVSITTITESVATTEPTIGPRRKRSRSRSNFGTWGETPANYTERQKGASTSNIGIWITNTIESGLINHYARCGDIFKANRTCTPEPDALNPCEDVMGYMWLRVVVWLVVSTALLGNLVVLVVTTSCQCRLTVAKFLMCNLAFADLCLGAYLFLLAAYDLHTSGVYFAYAIAWQTEGGCQVAGFLSTFSICLSIFTLTVITLERWYAIRHAINLSKRLRMRRATHVLTCGWAYSLAMATLPLVGVSSYGKTSLCLPMDTSTWRAEAYVFILLITNALAFLVILGCYVDMYRQVTNPGHTTVAGRNDANIAKRMAILVFTDFACLFPIAFFGITAAFGYPMITVTDSKILLVFFFPLNSCANPFLYAIFTKQFRKDLQSLAKKCSVCDPTAARYRAVYTSNPISGNSHSRTSQSVQVEPSCWGSVCPCCACFSRCTSDSRPDFGHSTPRSHRKQPSSTSTMAARANGVHHHHHQHHHPPLGPRDNIQGPTMYLLPINVHKTEQNINLNTVPEVNSISPDKDDPEAVLVDKRAVVVIRQPSPDETSDGVVKEAALRLLHGVNEKNREEVEENHTNVSNWSIKMVASTTETSIYSCSSGHVSSPTIEEKNENEEDVTQTVGTESQTRNTESQSEGIESQTRGTESQTRGTESQAVGTEPQTRGTESQSGGTESQHGSTKYPQHGSTESQAGGTESQGGGKKSQHGGTETHVGGPESQPEDTEYQQCEQLTSDSKQATDNKSCSSMIERNMVSAVVDKTDTDTKKRNMNHSPKSKCMDSCENSKCDLQNHKLPENTISERESTSLRDETDLEKSKRTSYQVTQF